MNRQKIITTLLAKLQDNFPKPNGVTEITFNTWFETLEQYTDEQIILAAKKILLRTDKFFPPVGEFVECILSGKNENLSQESDKLFETIVDAIKTCGPYQTPYFGNKAITRWINEQGGWFELCMMDFETLKWKKKEFIEAYANLKKVNIEEQKPLKCLPGFEKSNPVQIEHKPEKTTPDILKSQFQKLMAMTDNPKPSSNGSIFEERTEVGFNVE